MKVRGCVFLAIAIAAAHAVLAIVYASETPYRTPGRILSMRGTPAPDIGAPDERQHANYVQEILSGRGFPVFNPKAPDAGEHYEDHQPPLYYLITAGVGKLMGLDDVGDSVSYRLRWVNAAAGAGTVLGVFCLGLWGLGRADVGLGAAAVAAFLPMNCALSGAVSNDPLLFLLCTWTLAIVAFALRQGWSMKLAIAAGALTGLAILTKTTGIALLPILLLGVLIPQKKRPTLGMAALAILAVAVLSGPWLARNQVLYGDPFALRAFNEAFAGSPQASGFIGAFGAPAYWLDWVGWWTVRSFFGVFGYMDVWLTNSGMPGGNNSAYGLLAVLTGLGLLGSIPSFFSSAWKDARGVQVVNAAFLAVVVLLFARFNIQYFQGQGRYLYPAIGPIAVAVSVGCFALTGKRGAIAISLFAGLLLLVNAWAIAKLPSEFEKRSGAQIALRGRQRLEAGGLIDPKSRTMLGMGRFL